VQCLIQLLCGFQIAPKRLLHNDAGTRCTGAFCQPLGYDAKQAGGNRKVVQRVRCISEGSLQRYIGAFILIIAVNVLQVGDQFFERSGLEQAVRLNAFTGTGDQLIQRPAGFRDSDDRHIQIAAAGHGLKSRKYLFVRQIAAGAKENKRVRVSVFHGILFCRGIFHMAAEAVPHRRQNFRGELTLTTRAEALINGRA
jgi:hypothetical protein